MGVVFWPALVTGFSAMSRRQMMTFMEGRQLRENSSHRDGSFGPACRFILMTTFFVSAMRPQTNSQPAFIHRRVIPAHHAPRDDHPHRMVTLPHRICAHAA